jgi:hypothetical protein
MFGRPSTSIITITRQQYFNQLAKQGIITQQDADNALAGNLPDSMLDILNTIENMTSRFSANRMLSTGEGFYKEQPILYYIGNGYGMTEQQTNELFEAARSL